MFESMHINARFFLEMHSRLQGPTVPGALEDRTLSLASVEVPQWNMQTDPNTTVEGPKLDLGFACVWAFRFPMTFFGRPFAFGGSFYLFCVFFPFSHFVCLFTRFPCFSVFLVEFLQGVPNRSVFLPRFPCI